MSNRTHKWCKRWIRHHYFRSDFGLGIDVMLIFATQKVIGGRYERFGSHLTYPLRLLFNSDEAMLATNSRPIREVVALDKRVFGKRRKRPHHFIFGAIFSSLRHGPSPLTVVSTFSRADELFAGRSVLIREPCFGWCTGPSFVAIARHFCGLQFAYEAQNRVEPDEGAFLVVDNPQPHADSAAPRVCRANHVQVITLPPHFIHCIQPVCVACCETKSRHRVELF
jgi:hypothetical protein